MDLKIEMVEKNLKMLLLILIGVIIGLIIGLFINIEMLGSALNLLESYSGSYPLNLTAGF